MAKKKQKQRITRHGHGKRPHIEIEYEKAMEIKGDGESSKTKYADPKLKVVERDGDEVERAKQKQKQKQEGIARDGDGKRPQIEDEDEKAMEIEGDGVSSKTKYADPTLKVVERDGDEVEREVDLFSRPFNSIKAGETIDIMSILFPKSRDFLIKNDGEKVHFESLKGKTIVLYVVPLDIPCYLEPWSTLDMIDAYDDLSPKGDVQFVFVAVPILYPHYTRNYPEPKPEVQEALFHHILDKLPFPAIPFWDKEAQKRVVSDFMLDHILCAGIYYLPYWSIIDSTTNTVEASITDVDVRYASLFNFYGGEELYPLTCENIFSVTSQSFKPSDILYNLDKILGPSDSDFLLSGTGNKVFISSLKHKVIGLYFREFGQPPYIDDIYEKAKKKKSSFEIVQIDVRFHPDTGATTDLELLSLDQLSVNEKPTTDWLRLPYKDPRRKKLVRIFVDACDQNKIECSSGHLVIVQPQRDIFEFSGFGILGAYGIEGYPFTRDRLFELEKERHKSVKLDLLFPPGKCNLKLWKGDRYDEIDNAQLLGKKVLVLFTVCDYIRYFPRCVDMLSSKYKDAKEDKFEVVFVSFASDESKFDKCVKGMPWLVHSYSKDIECELKSRLFKCCGRFSDIAAGIAAFGEDGDLITKIYNFYSLEMFTDRFPFIKLNLDDAIRWEVRCMCKLDEYCVDDDDDDDDAI